MTAEVAILNNLHSGADNGKDRGALVRDVFAEVGVPVDIFNIEPTQVEDKAKELGQSNYRIVVAAGGDGTIRTVAANLINTNKVLGVIPTGTMNNFARTLKIPLDIKQAIKIIITGKTKPIDVGEVNGEIFINNSSIGVYPHLVRHRKQAEKQGMGKIRAFILAIFHVFQKYPLLNIQLKLNENIINQTTPAIFVGNNIYKLENPFDVGSRERVDQGILSVFVAKKTNQWELIKLFLSNLFGTIYSEEKFAYYFTKNLRIESPRKTLRVATDGEVLELRTPLLYQSLPAALRVIIP